MKQTIRWAFFLVGVMIFSMGITLTINVQHLGIHPWDVLNVAFFHHFGLSIGSWAIIVSGLLILITLIMDRGYIRLGTFFNAFLVGLFVDFYMWLDFLPVATNRWIDILIILAGIVVMGFGGGMYNAGGVGSGPRDGFMLSLSDKTGISISRVRIIVETLILVLGIVVGGPVFIFTFLFTFIQSPIFQQSYLFFKSLIKKIEGKLDREAQVPVKKELS
ncbi:YczE/YyaS/YitT family protein [Oceanobacillus indicireducens]|uniref:Permease n=1 Tax=Oceanobacillus indicireducens TaxID=1004261 RepID=A0A917XS36_9BACI|nr:YitT family protein [Oceanobacillus indicireducens]GGN51390.1 permease [Oceanobacillus indicireducens]